MHLLSSNFLNEAIDYRTFWGVCTATKKAAENVYRNDPVSYNFCSFLLFTCIIPLSRLYIQFQLNFVFGLFFECLHLLRIDSRQLIQRRYAESSKKFFSGSE